MRLDKLLAQAAEGTRSEIRDAVARGRVTVDGETARQAGQQVPDGAVVRLDGREITHRGYQYWMLHKPLGLLTATQDASEPTVMDCLPSALKTRGLSPVGRLDRDTSGLLLLTDDGELNHRLLAPRFHVDKVYLAEVEGQLTGEDEEAFARGIPLKDFCTMPARLEILSVSDGRSTARVTVREGKFHQVRRMFGARGKPVLQLARIAMGPLSLDPDLSPGACRPLTPEEIRLLKEYAREKE